MCKVYLSLGSNLGQRAENLAQALRMLGEKLKIVQVSAIYETEPVGIREQPWFLNLVCAAETELSPQELLAFFQGIEGKVGRVRERRFGPRLIDIDILFYDGLIIRTPSLEIPHPRLTERAFVLVPLVEIAPGLLHPVLKLTMREILEKAEGLEEIHPYRG